MVNNCWGHDVLLIFLEEETCLESPLLFLIRGNSKVPTKATLVKAGLPTGCHNWHVKLSLGFISELPGKQVDRKGQ